MTESADPVAPAGTSAGVSLGKPPQGTHPLEPAPGPYPSWDTPPDASPYPVVTPYEVSPPLPPPSAQPPASMARHYAASNLPPPGPSVMIPPAIAPSTAYASDPIDRIRPRGVGKRAFLALLVLLTAAATAGLVFVGGKVNSFVTQGDAISLGTDVVGGRPVGSAPGPSPQVQQGAAATSTSTDLRRKPAAVAKGIVYQTKSTGDACPRVKTTTYAGYLDARCTFWTPTAGLLTKEPLAKGAHLVTCQRNLKRANPVYTAKQTNTWWVWARSTGGSWDWFPETAIAQGASNQAINGIAVCR